MKYEFVAAKSIIQNGNSVNLYWGCTHNCIYCDSRSECYNKPNFETIKVKKDCIKIFTEEIYRKKQWCLISTGAMCDPYIPLEEEVKLTKDMLEIILKRKFGVGLLTKSDLILRDLELIKAINKESKAVVQMTIITTDDKLCSLLEPNVCLSSRRFEVLKTFADAGVPTGIWLAPVLPFICDNPENIRDIVFKAHQANVKFILCFGIGTSKRKGSEEYFYACLDKSFPGLKEKYIRTYGSQYICSSPREKELYKVLAFECQKYGILYKGQDIKNLFRRKKQFKQLSIFD
ncbi:MAG: radical SAM protein [Erysipelotrichales bacterium]|nr:radical SAM protein [Erysipelotrichales bacterium]